MKGSNKRGSNKHLAIKYIIEELTQVYDDIDDSVREEYLKGALEILKEEEVLHES